MFRCVLHIVKWIQVQWIDKDTMFQSDLIIVWAWYSQLQKIDFCFPLAKTCIKELKQERRLIFSIHQSIMGLYNIYV